MSNLKNIIFDLGGVLLNIDINKTEQAFINLGFADFHHMYNQHAANELFAALETGSVSTEEFFIPLATWPVNHLQKTNWPMPGMLCYLISGQKASIFSIH